MKSSLLKHNLVGLSAVDLERFVGRDSDEVGTVIPRSESCLGQEAGVSILDGFHVLEWWAFVHLEFSVLSRKHAFEWSGLLDIDSQKRLAWSNDVTDFASSLNVRSGTSQLTTTNDTYLIVVICPGNIIYLSTGQHSFLFPLGDEGPFGIRPAKHFDIASGVTHGKVGADVVVSDAGDIVQHFEVVNVSVFPVVKVAQDEVLADSVGDDALASVVIWFQRPLHSEGALGARIWGENSSLLKLKSFHLSSIKIREKQ